MRQHVADEVELRRVDPSFVFARAVRLRLVGAEIVDVVQHQEQRLRIEEGIVVRAEHALVGFAAVASVGGLEVEVVVAADIPPRQADRPDDPVVAVVEREIVEHDVAQREAELRLRARQRLDDVLADIVDLDIRLRLRIGEQHDLEGVRLLLAFSAKSTEAGRGPVGAMPANSRLSEAGEPAGLMQAIEARQVGHGVERRHEARRLDDEDRSLVGQRQNVAALGIRRRDLSAVGDEHARQARIGGTGLAGAVAVLEDDPRHGRRIGPPAGAPAVNAAATPPAAAISASRREISRVKSCAMDGLLKDQNRARPSGAGEREGVVKVGPPSKIRQRRFPPFPVKRRFPSRPFRPMMREWQGNCILALSSDCQTEAHYGGRYIGREAPNPSQLSLSRAKRLARPLRAANDAARLAARGGGRDGNQGRLRRGRLRRLHGRAFAPARRGV